MCNHISNFKGDFDKIAIKPCSFDICLNNLKQINPEIKFVLPLDSEGKCIFHSKNTEWKKENECDQLFVKFLKLLAKYNQSMEVYEIQIVGGEKKGCYKKTNYENVIIENIQNKNLKLIFRGCSFESGIELHNIELDELTFNSCIFKEPVKILNSTFNFADFHRTEFAKSLDMHASRVISHTDFHEATLGASTTISECNFESFVDFSDLINNNGDRFGSTFKIEKCNFDKNVDFKKTHFFTHVVFENVSFGDTVNFVDTIFEEIDNAIKMVESAFVFRNIQLRNSSKILFLSKDANNKMFSDTVFFDFVPDHEASIFLKNVNFSNIHHESVDRLLAMQLAGQCSIEPSYTPNGIQQTPQIATNINEIPDKKVVLKPLDQEILILTDKIDDDLTKIWGKDYEYKIKIFLSHRSIFKDETAKLKLKLESFGIASFVAHENIAPNSIWEQELERALESMDVLVSLMVDEDSTKLEISTDLMEPSEWVAREIKYALKLKRTVIPVRFGKRTYTILKEKQAIIPKKNHELAPHELIAVLFLDQAVKNKMILAFTNAMIASASYDISNGLATCLPYIPKLTEEQGLDLADAYNSNSQIYNCPAFNGKQSYHYGAGIMHVAKEILPFDIKFGGNKLKPILNSSNIDLINIWGESYDLKIKVFLSHKTDYKEEAASLKNNLEIYGLSCFVAHEDIKPTTLWQNEIEKALESMDVLVALMTPAFSSSKWTDQEIGIAIGKNKPVIPVIMGLKPYGFIEKFQGITPKKSKELAPAELLKVLFTNPTIKDKMIAVFICRMKNSVSYAQSENLAICLPFIPKLSVNQTEQIIEAYNSNSQIYDCYFFNGEKPFYYAEGMLNIIQDKLAFEVKYEGKLLRKK